MIFTLTSIHHISGDACWHLSVAKFIAEEQKIPLSENLGRDEPFWAPPLFHLFAAFAYSVFNGLIKFVTPIFAILTLIFTFLLAKRLFSEKIAFHSVLFMSFIPIFIDYSVFSYVESMLLFFIVLSVYFAVNNRIILASIAAGLGILTKYNALFIIPLLVYIVYKNNKTSIIKNTLMITLIPLIISSPWLIRNWILLGNPVWPFLNFVFNGLQAASYTGMDFSRLVDINLIVYTYLGFFGVPNGNPQNLFFFSMPFMNLLITAWLIGTFIFILPITYSKKVKNKAIMVVWAVPYLLLFLLYVLNVGFGVTRIILPALPAIAILWAHGFDRLTKLKWKKFVWTVLILIIAGFVFAESVKIGLAANEWNFYEQDFEWAQANTSKNSVFVAGGQCLGYNLERSALQPSEINIENADYIWVNQNFRLDKRSVLDDVLLKEVQDKGLQIAYQNSKTGTIIYKVK